MLHSFILSLLHEENIIEQERRKKNNLFEEFFFIMFRYACVCVCVGEVYNDIIVLTTNKTNNI